MKTKPKEKSVKELIEEFEVLFRKSLHELEHHKIVDEHVPRYS